MIRGLTVFYFKASGKYYSHEDVEVDESAFLMAPASEARKYLIDRNEGRAPGLSNDGAEFHWVCLPVGNWGYPRMFPSFEPSPLHRLVPRMPVLGSLAMANGGST